jgi:Immunity protein 52
LSESTYAGGYWGPRAESVEECAARLTRFLVELEAAHPLLAMRYKRGPSLRSATSNRVTPALDTIAALLSGGRSRGDTDGAVIEDLGYSMGLWNGESSAGADVSVGCGMTSAWVDNAVVLRLPVDDDGRPVPLPAGVNRQAFTSLVECWAPDWATWTSHAARDTQPDDADSIVLGWLTYLSTAAGSVSIRKLPTGVTAEPFAAGTLLTIGDGSTPLDPRLLTAARAALPRPRRRGR